MAVAILTVVRYELCLFVVSLAVVVGYRLLIGEINLKGLLSDKEGQRFSAVRFQLLFVVLGGAVYYASVCYQAHRFAPVPGGLTALLGGSNSWYLVRKYLARMAR